MAKPIIELKKAIREATDEAVHDVLFTSGYLQTCLNCTKFEEEKEVCTLAGARPPARVIAFGCEAFVEAEDEPAAAPAPTLPPPKPRPASGFDDFDDDIPF